MKPTHKPVCSCENGEYSAMALGFTSGFDQKMSEPWVIKEELLDMPEEEVEQLQVKDPIQAKQRIEEALGIIKDLGLERGQQNERSALTLLALLNLKPDIP